MDKFINQAIDRLKVVEDKGTIDGDSVFYMMAQIRQHLEANNLKNSYRILNFYCDWCLHVQLDRNPIAKELFQQIDKAIPDKGTWLNDAICRLIAIHQLRADLIKVMGSVGENAKLFNSLAGWKAFVHFLLGQLAEKPLKRTPSTNSGAEQFILSPIDISTIDKDFLKVEGIPEDGIFWKAQIMPVGYYLSGPLVIAEHPTDFKFR